MGKLVPLSSQRSKASSEPAARCAPERDHDRSAKDRDLLAIEIVLWCASLLRVAMAVREHEVFGSEPTLALACVVLIPWLWIRARA